MAKPGLGVVGLGIGRRYAEHAREAGFGKLAVCDVNPERLRSAARAVSADESTADFSNLLEDGSLQAIVVATPDNLHQGMVVAAAQTGKNVLCETPLALRRPSAELAVDAVLEAGLQVVVAHRFRFHPLVHLLRAELNDGRIGEVGLVEGRWLRSAENAPEGWRLDPALKRTLAIGEAVDVVDALRWLMGDLYEVTGFTTRKFFPDWPIGDTVASSGRFLRGAALHCVLSIGGQGRPATELRVHGSEGSLSCDLGAGELSLLRKDELVVLGVSRSLSEMGLERDILKSFAEVIRGEVENPCDPVEGANAVITAIAIADSSSVNLPARVRPVLVEDC